MKLWQTTHTTTSSKPKMTPIQTSTGSTNHHQKNTILETIETLKAESGAAPQSEPQKQQTAATEELAHTRDMPGRFVGAANAPGGRAAGVGGRRAEGGGEAGEMVGGFLRYCRRKPCPSSSAHTTTITRIWEGRN